MSTTKSMYRITVSEHLGFGKFFPVPVASTRAVAMLRDPSGPPETVPRSAGPFTDIKWARTIHSRIEVNDPRRKVPT